MTTLPFSMQAELDSGKPLIVVPEGRYRCPPGGFLVPDNTAVVGVMPLCRNRVGPGAWFVPHSPDDDAFVLDPADGFGNIRFQDIGVKGAEQPGRGCGFRLNATGEQIPAHIDFERCMVWGVGGDGFNLSHDSRSLDAVTLRDCSACHCCCRGLYLERGAWTRVRDFSVIANKGIGVHVKLSDCSVLEDAYCDGNGSPGVDPQFRIEDTMGLDVVRGACERFWNGVGLELRGGRECTVERMKFLSGSPAAAPTGTGVVGVSTDSPWIGRCLFRGVKTMTAGCGTGNTSAQDVSRW